jgi:hypothetical protein
MLRVEPPIPNNLLLPPQPLTMALDDDILLMVLTAVEHL